MRVKLGWLYNVKAFAYVIIGIAAIIALAGGLYVLSPFFVAIAAGYNEASPIVSGLVENNAVPILGSVMVGVPLSIFAGMGLKKPKLVKRGTFALSMVFIFVAALRVFAIGIFPLVWTYVLGMGLIIALCRLVIE